MIALRQPTQKSCSSQPATHNEHTGKDGHSAHWRSIYTASGKQICMHSRLQALGPNPCLSSAVHDILFRLASLFALRRVHHSRWCTASRSQPSVQDFAHCAFCIVDRVEMRVVHAIQCILNLSSMCAPRTYCIKHTACGNNLLIMADSPGLHNQIGCFGLEALAGCVTSGEEVWQDECAGIGGVSTGFRNWVCAA